MLPLFDVSPVDLRHDIGRRRHLVSGSVRRRVRPRFGQFLQVFELAEGSSSRLPREDVPSAMLVHLEARASARLALSSNYDRFTFSARKPADTMCQK